MRNRWSAIPGIANMGAVVLVEVTVIFLLVATIVGSATRNREVQAKGAFAAVVVTDLDGSLKWYETNLGLHVVKRGRSPRASATTVVLGGNNLFVEIIHYDSPATAKPALDDTRPLTPGLIKVGTILDAQDFDSLARRLHSQVFEDKEMGVRSFLVKDNEGNLLQFFVKTR